MGVLTHIETADPTLADQELVDWLMDGTAVGDLVDFGGRDRILTGEGDDIVLGGSDNDDIDTGALVGHDFVIGDNGLARFTDTGIPITIHTTFPAFGGDDDIVIGDGDDIVFGGIGVDFVNVDRDTAEQIGVDEGRDVVDVGAVWC